MPLPLQKTKKKMRITKKNPPLNLASRVSYRIWNPLLIRNPIRLLSAVSNPIRNPTCKRQELLFLRRDRPNPALTTLHRWETLLKIETNPPERKGKWKVKRWNVYEPKRERERQARIGNKKERDYGTQGTMRAVIVKVRVGWALENNKNERIECESLG